MNRRLLVAAGAAALVAALGITPLAGAEQGGRQLKDLRLATQHYQDFSAAESEGFGIVRDNQENTCIDDAAGAMGTHFVKVPRLLDSEINTLEPELLLYDMTSSTPRLIAVEYVVFADAWHEAHGAQPPKQFGKKFTLIPEGNRFDLPAFYEQHVWVWESNPAGLLADWNPDVTCSTT